MRSCPQLTFYLSPCQQAQIWKSLSSLTGAELRCARCILLYLFPRLYALLNDLLVSAMGPCSDNTRRTVRIGPIDEPERLVRTKMGREAAVRTKAPEGGRTWKLSGQNDLKISHFCPDIFGGLGTL